MAVTLGCGDSGGLYPEEPKVPEIPESSNALLPNIDRVDWYFPCADNKIDDAMEFDQEGKQLLYGYGPFLNSRQDNEQAEVGVSFGLCEPRSRQQPRQILLVVDSSIPAAEQDPLAQGTCGRFEVIQQALLHLDDPNSQDRLALLSFADQSMISSAGFAGNGSEFYSATGLDTEASLAEMICSGWGPREMTAIWPKAAEILRLYRQQDVTTQLVLLSGASPEPHEGLSDDYDPKNLDFVWPGIEFDLISGPVTMVLEVDYYNDLTGSESRQKGEVTWQ